MKFNIKTSDDKYNIMVDNNATTIASYSTQPVTILQTEVIKSKNNIARQAMKAIESSNDKVNNLLSFLNEVEIQSTVNMNNSP